MNLQNNCLTVSLFFFLDDSGMRRSDLVNQYLKDMESQNKIETEEDLAEKKMLVDKVLDRLINHVSL